MKGYKKLGKNIILLTVGNFASKVLSFFLVPFYTTVLSTKEYGSADILTTSINLILPIFSMLIYESVLRFLLDDTNDKKQIITIGLMINLIGFFVFLFFSPLCLFISTIKEYYIVFVMYYLSSSLFNITSQYIKGIENVSLFTLGGVLNTIFMISFNILFLLYFKIGVFGYLSSFILSQLLVSLLYVIKGHILKELISIRTIDFVLAKKMLKYSIPMIPNSLSWWISDSSDKYLVTFFKGVSVTGLYSVAYKIPTILTILTSIFMSAWQISSVENFGTEENRKFFSDIYVKYASCTIILCTGLITFAKIISQFLFSNNFFDAWIYTPVLLLGFVFNSMSAFFGTVYTAAKKTQMLFYSTLIGAFVNIFLNIILIQKYSALGAAIATMLSYFFVWMIRFFNSHKIMKLDIDIKGNIVSYALLLIQVVLVCLDLQYSFFISIFINFLIIKLNFNLINDVYLLIKKNIVKN